MHGLPEKELQQIKEELDNCQKPIFLFHDDADGLCSFLLLYGIKKEGQGIVIKSKTGVDEKFIRSVVNYGADKVFVLDLALMNQDFVDGVKRPVIWIDHHGPTKLNNVVYFNPRIHKKDEIYPVTNICYDIAKDNLWIAMAGCIADWHMPYFKDEFCEKYPDLMDKSIKDPGKALFETKLGKLIKILNFVLRGDTVEAKKCVNILTRIKSPYEILNKETSQAKYLYNQFERVNHGYVGLFEDVKKKINPDDRFLIYTYPDNKASFTGELSNELLYRYPEKIIVIAREKSGEMRMSLRSSNVVIPPILKKALTGLDGFGGGHEYACGANVKTEQFEEFISRLRKEIG
jgi:single-stranded DNA-specific DHH superfamily exonuclease